MAFSITINFTDEEERILSIFFDSLDAKRLMEKWVTHAVRNKMNKIIDRLIVEKTDKNPTKLELDNKITLIKNHFYSEGG